MYKSAVNFLTTDNIHTKGQFGSRKCPWSDKALYKIIDKALFAFNDKMHGGGIFWPCYSTWCVNHELLLSELNLYGIQDKAGQWFKSYLHKRQ